MKKSFVVLIIVLACSYTASAQIENIQHSQLTQKDGLLRSTVTCILKDSKGFMWFGSRSGLSRYDGYNFVHYTNDVNDSTSISDNYIIGIYEDKSGGLWVSASNGLNKFNREKETFRRFWHQSLLDPEKDNNLTHMVPGRKNKLWLATWSSGIIQFDLEKEKFSLFQVKTKEDDGSVNRAVTDIREDENGNLWVGSLGGGLYKYDLTDNNKFLAHYSDSPDAVHRISNNTISSLFQDSSGDIWISTINGLNRISTTKDAGRTETITQFYHEPENPYSISHNLTSSISEDHSGTLWIRTGNGMNTYNRETGQFNAWEHDENRVISLETHLCLRSLLIDNEGIIWFGLQNQGVSNFIIRHNKFNLIQHNPDNPNSLNNNFVTSIYQDTSGVLWIGTDEGLNRCLPGKTPDDSPAWHLYTHDPANPSSISSNRIRTVYRDRQGVLWIGTLHGGLNKYIDSGDGLGQFKHYDF